MRWLLTLTLASAGLYLLSQLVSLFGADTAGTADALQRQGVSAEQAATLAEQSAAVGVVTAIVLIVVALGLYALVYVFLKKGRNWARVLGIVLLVLSTVLTVLGIVGTLAFGGLAAGVLGIVVTLLSVAFVVVNVLWLVTAVKAPVKRWFSGARAY